MARPHQPTPFGLGHRSGADSPPAMPTAPLAYRLASLPPLCPYARPSPSPRLEAGPSLAYSLGGCRLVQARQEGGKNWAPIGKRGRFQPCTPTEGTVHVPLLVQRKVGVAKSGRKRGFRPQGWLDIEMERLRLVLGLPKRLDDLDPKNVKCSFWVLGRQKHWVFLLCKNFHRESIQNCNRVDTLKFLTR